ncbi:MAG: GNAT family N-acetyltransferase [Pseudomonadota bacterium]
MQIRELHPGDIEPLKCLLVRAFEGDPAFRFMVSDSAAWVRFAGRYFELALRSAHHQGLAFTDRLRRGVALWESPGTRASLLGQFWQFCRLAHIYGNNFGNALAIQRVTRKYRPRRDHWYLSCLATDPGHRGRGVADALLAPMLALASQQQLPVFLDCLNRDNVPFYLSRGFSLVDEVTLANGLKVWPMIREPG